MKSDGFKYPFAGFRTTFAYTGTMHPGADTTLAFGAERTEEAFEAGIDAGEQETVGVFAEVLQQVSPATEMAFALRYDAHSDFDDVISGRVGVVWDVDDETSLRAAAGTGFRAPSLYERFGFWGGNPALEPEHSRSFELSVARRFGASNVAATAFATEIDDLIQYVGDSNVQVDGVARTHGMEATADIPLTPRLRLFGNYTYTDAKDGQGVRLQRVPRHDLLVGIDARLAERFDALASFRHVADTLDQGQALHDYTVADLRLGYRLSGTAEAYLRVENLFDEEYQTAIGYGTPDRSFHVGVRASF